MTQKKWALEAQRKMNFKLKTVFRNGLHYICFYINKNCRIVIGAEKLEDVEWKVNEIYLFVIHSKSESQWKKYLQTEAEIFHYYTKVYPLQNKPLTP